MNKTPKVTQMMMNLQVCLKGPEQEAILEWIGPLTYLETDSIGLTC